MCHDFLLAMVYKFTLYDMMFSMNKTCVACLTTQKMSQDFEMCLNARISLCWHCLAYLLSK